MIKDKLKLVNVGTKTLGIGNIHDSQTILSPLPTKAIEDVKIYLKNSKEVQRSMKVCLACGSHIQEDYLWGLQCPICGNTMILESSRSMVKGENVGT